MMPSEHTPLSGLQVYRDMLVEKRRRIVADDTVTRLDQAGTPYEQNLEPNLNRAGDLVMVQDQIEAIDRAIADENKLKPSSGPRVRVV